MYIQLNNLTLKTIDKTNPEDTKFLENIFNNRSDKNIEFLGNLSKYITDRTYIVINENNQKIGYFSMTDPILNRENLTSVSLYYAISKEYRNQGYATKLVEEITNYLIQNNIADMIILTIDNQNIASITVAEKLNFTIKFQDESEAIYIKNIKNRKKVK